MGLEWVRMDSNISSHDKILQLVLFDPSPDRWQACSSYVFSIGWSGGHGTDGVIPSAALAFVHGTAETARLLVKYHLWVEETDGYRLPNFAVRQELAIVTEAKRAAQQAGAIKGNCIRYHGKDCGCWRETLASMDR